MPHQFKGGQRVRWMSEAEGGERNGMVHCAYPEHWPQLKSDEVPVVTQFALLVVDSSTLELDE